MPPLEMSAQLQKSGYPVKSTYILLPTDAITPTVPTSPGRTLSLAERPLLWRILCAVAEGGGTVDKEALVIGAWEVRSYNSLCDDARMHSAVRMLRRAIEEDPANPVRFLATEEGYAFGRGAPVRRLVVSHNG